MNYEQMNNNKVYLRGKVVSAPVFSHEVCEEKFYEINFEVKRLSDATDIIPVIISEKLLASSNFNIGEDVAIRGQYRSYNSQQNNKSKLILNVFAREVVEIDELQNPNTIELTGYICKPSVFRVTPFKREICDVLIAVNRAYNKSDYLPCIAWGRNARFVKNLQVGEKVNILGRIQSREYQKKIDENTTETKVAYEISIAQISCENLSSTIYDSVGTGAGAQSTVVG